MKIYSRVFSYAFRHKFLLFCSIAFALTLVVGKVGGIFQLGNFFSDTFIGKDFERVNPVTIILLVGLALLWAGSHYLILICSNTLAVSVMHDIRRDLYERMIDLPVSYYKKNRTGEILSRILNDIGIIEIFFMNILVEIFAQPMTVVVIVVLMFGMNPKISLFFFSIGPVLALVLAGVGSIVQRLSMKVQKNISDITSGIQETVYGIEVIKGFAVEGHQKEKFSEANDNYLKATKKEIKFRFLGTPSSEFLGVIGVLVILILGAIGVQSGVATSKEIVNFILLALVLSEPLSRSSDIFMVLRKLHPAAQRIFEIIDSKERENPDLPSIGEIRGGVEFRNVSFEYENGLNTLKNVKLKIEAGETVAIVGPSGAGKSSLISLIPAFYSPTSGTVEIDGKDLKRHNPFSIRSQLSLVTQDNILFSGTIAENIRLSKPGATDSEVEQAAKLANAHGFISSMKKGYRTVLGDRGVRLSGGEKQRIALARALLRKPKILIMDEATSSLDAESEREIQSAMKKILGRQTTLIITHKLSTIADSDRIIVMENGRIIESGTHRELLQQKGIYHRLFRVQVTV